MVYSLKLTFVANGKNSTDIGLAPVKTIWFGSLKFTANHFSNLSLSPVGDDSHTVFVGMVHNGLPSVHTIHEESSNDGDASLGRGEGSGLSGPQRCNMVTPIAPITTIPPPENALALLTIPTVSLWTAAPEPGIGLLLEQQQAYQDE
jgi:hypothetical protein